MPRVLPAARLSLFFRCDGTPKSLCRIAIEDFLDNRRNAGYVKESRPNDGPAFGLSNSTDYKYKDYTGGTILKRLCYLMALTVLLLPFTAYTQDAGVTDTVKLFGDTLYIGRSAPLRLNVINDRPMKAFLFGLITDGSSGGFARLDSIVYVNRMADTTAMNLRLGGPRDGEGVSPDTM